MVDFTEKYNELEDKIEDQINRGMRNNLIIKGLPEDENESWEETKRIVSDTLRKFNEDNSPAINQIERAHRSSAKKTPGRLGHHGRLDAPSHSAAAIGLSRTHSKHSPQPVT